MVELTEQTEQSRWKTKYLDALDVQERIERDAGSRVNDLGTLIARLARTLPGKESAALKKRLGTLTDALKRNPFDARLGRDINDVHTRVLDVIELHDQERTDASGALREAVTQLEAHCANRKLKRALKQFGSSLSREEQPPVSELLGGLRELQGRVLDLASAADSRPCDVGSDVVFPPVPSVQIGAARAASVLSTELTDEPPSSTSEEVAVAKRRDTDDAADSHGDGDGESGGIEWPAVSDVLSNLIARLSIPSEFKTQVEQLKVCIADNLDEQSLPGILVQIRELIDISLAVMDREFRGFLDSVDQRLDTLLCTLGQAHEQEQAALTREQGLADSFQERLDTMRDDAGSATDLAELKNSIDEHLDTLVRSMMDINNEGRMASGERDTRLLAMTNRLQELESESKQARSQLETQRRLALTDGLTGLANRKALDGRLNEEISIAVQRSTPISVALADIDHFKHVNDTYGHAAGDRALALFARILGSRVRASDFCARYGGEEFVILFPATNAEMAAQVVEQVREFVQKCGFSYKGIPVPLTASFGIAELIPGDDPTSILERADRAMYEAKSGGRNRVCRAST
ncbi:MAG: diguanylate cyclase [Gammaproteobacteria bacterium]